MAQSNSEKEDRPDRPLDDDPFPLSRARRVWLGIGALLLAFLHLFVPALKLDAISVGLLAFALAMFFARITKITFPWLNLETQKALRRVREAALPSAPEEPPAVPVIATGSVEHTVDAYLGQPEPDAAMFPTLHREPGDLFPPTDPSEFLLWITENIANELVILAGNSGQSQTVPRTFPRVSDLASFAAYLVTRKILPEDLLGPIRLVATTRNAMVHGKLDRERDVAPINELGTSAFVKLKQIERFWYRVRLSHVDLFLDRGFTAPLGTHGLMIVTLDSEGNEHKDPKVYPRYHEYKTGRFVTWEWNMERVFRKEAWYADPGTKQPKLAFTSAATFGGREYPDQWGLEYRFPRPDVGLLERWPT